MFFVEEQQNAEGLVLVLLEKTNEEKEKKGRRKETEWGTEVK
jgi:hypothetical protein